MTENSGEVELTLPRIEISPIIEDLFGEARAFADEFRMNVCGSQMFAAAGIQPDKTYLLYGRPGLGKTMATKAIYNSANKKVFDKFHSGTRREQSEMNSDYLELLSFEYDVGKFGTAYINMSSRKVENFFQKAGAYAAAGRPTMIVLDECDSILGDRGSGIQSHSEDRKTLETIMKNLQIAHDSPNLYVVLMTNLADACDSASLRAGRIDRKIEFKLPEFDARKKAFESTIDAHNDRCMYKIIRGSDYNTLAEMSDGFNYADINQSVEGAVRGRIKKILSNSSKKIITAPYVSRKGLEDAVKNHSEEFHSDSNGTIGFKHG